MAAFIGKAHTAEVALVVDTAKTVLQIVAPSNHRLKIIGWGVFFDGTSATAEPVKVELLRQSTAGTMSANTPVKWDDSLAETLQTTAQDNATGEPTPGDILERKEVHPQTSYEKIFPLSQEPTVGGGDRLGIRCEAAAVVNVRGEILFEE